MADRGIPVEIPNAAVLNEYSDGLEGHRPRFRVTFSVEVWAPGEHNAAYIARLMMLDPGAITDVYVEQIEETEG